MTESGTSLVVQWLRLGAYTAGVVGSIPAWGIKIPHAVRRSQNIGKKRKGSFPPKVPCQSMSLAAVIEVSSPCCLCPDLMPHLFSF